MSEIRKVIKLGEVQSWQRYGDRKSGDDTEWKTLISEEVNGSKDLLFGICRLQPGGTHLSHCHKKESELYYVIKGRAKVTIDEMEVDADAGTAIYMPAGTTHKVVNDGNETWIAAYAYNFPSSKKLTYEWTE